MMEDWGLGFVAAGSCFFREAFFETVTEFERFKKRNQNVSKRNGFRSGGRSRFRVDTAWLAHERSAFLSTFEPSA
jgi:hypothetical protein